MNIFILILGMAVVTYLPRLIPVVLVERLNFSPKIQKFLSLIPYTAMTALVFPGVLTIANNNIFIGLTGAAAAILLSLKKAPMMLVIVGAIVAVMAAQWIL